MDILAGIFIFVVVMLILVGAKNMASDAVKSVVVLATLTDKEKQELRAKLLS
jgi:hypothetical protein